jgi:hypothetical protein
MYPSQEPVSFDLMDAVRLTAYVEKLRILLPAELNYRKRSKMEAEIKSVDRFIQNYNKSLYIFIVADF